RGARRCQRARARRDRRRSLRPHGTAFHAGRLRDRGSAARTGSEGDRAAARCGARGTLTARDLMGARTVREKSVTVREALFAQLRDFGLTTVFGNPGSTELPMFRDFPADFRYVLGLQESVVASMADGYAQAHGGGAVVNLHSAVGVGHALGAIFTAYRNQIPLLVIAGQQARSMLPFEPFLFSEQAANLPRPYVKWSCEPARAEDVPLALAHAWYTAMQPPRGPAFVCVPVDDWDRRCEPVAARSVSRTVAGDQGLLKHAA